MSAIIPIYKMHRHDLPPLGFITFDVLDGMLAFLCSAPMPREYVFEILGNAGIRITKTDTNGNVISGEISELSQVKPTGCITEGIKMADTIDSTSDARTENNVMRHQYKKLTDEEKRAMLRLKDDGLEFHEFVDSLGQSRELSLAKTAIEEAVMWAVKHVTG